MTIAHDYENGADLIKKGEAIVEKYRPTFIPEKGLGYKEGYSVIRWCFETYPMFGQSGDILSSSPYGGSTVTYPNYEEDETAALHGSQAYNTGTSQFVPANGEEHPANPEHWTTTRDYMKGQGLPSNRIFVLTVTCNYPFSNSLVKWLFNGGVNTKIVSKWCAGSESKYEGKPGTMYLLWARGAGIVNAK